MHSKREEIIPMPIKGRPYKHQIRAFNGFSIKVIFDFHLTRLLEFRIFEIRRANVFLSAKQKEGQETLFSVKPVRLAALRVII